MPNRRHTLNRSYPFTKSYAEVSIRYYLDEKVAIDR